MFKEEDLVMRRVILCLDAFIISFVFLSVFLIFYSFPQIYKYDFFENVHVVKPLYLSSADYLVTCVIVVVLWCTILSVNKMYIGMRIKSVHEILWIIIKSAIIVTVAFSALTFLFKIRYVSRLFFISFMIASSFFILFEKIIILYITQKILRKGDNNKNILLIGTGKRASHFRDVINVHPEWGYKIAKIVDLEKCLQYHGKDIKQCEVIAEEQDLRKILHNMPIDEVIFVAPKSRLDLVENYIYVCEDEGIDAAVAVDFFDVKLSNLHFTDLDGIPLLTMEKRFDKEWQLFIKRTVDIVISGVGLLLLSPLFFVVSILIKFTSSGPVFFTQKRVSLHGRIFNVFKFRSMYKEAEKQLDKVTVLNEMDGPVFKIKNDPRITPLGKFLRKSSIDELPQLLNVFMGTMSLVGPRPALPKEVTQYKASQRRRLSVRPGITCIWQAYHRGEKDFDKWMQSDYEYIDNWSLALDFRIFLRTIIVAISGKGAY